MSNARRLARLERLEEALPDPLATCCLWYETRDEAEAEREAVTRAFEADPNPRKNWVDHARAALPTTCKRTGGDLCPEGAARVAQIHRNLESARAALGDLSTCPELRE